MDPINKKTRKRAIGRFLIYYIISLLVIALVVFFFISPDYFFSVKDRISSFNITDNSNYNKQLVLKQVDSLNKYLTALKQLDQLHFSGLVDSASSKTFNNQVNNIEDNCAFLIDRINSNYNISGDNSKEMAEKVADSYTTFLDIHRELLRHAANSGVFIQKESSVDQPTQLPNQVAQLTSDIKERDETVSLLQTQLHKLQVEAGGTNTNNTVIQQLQEENQRLKNDLAANQQQKNQLQNNYEQLQNQASNLKESLSVALQKQQAAASPSSSTNTKEIANLQAKVNQLNAEVALAKIDCNIKRADVNSNVSSARQRKDLLTESLKSLNVLIKSDNAAIQQEARARLSELNNVAKTIRE